MFRVGKVFVLLFNCGVSILFFGLYNMIKFVILDILLVGKDVIEWMESFNEKIIKKSLRVLE